MKSIAILLAMLVLTGWTSALSAIPIAAADIVDVDEFEWAQVDLFTNLSWNDINAVCPNGTCGVGSLGGYSMFGWKWASADEVNSLFNYYISRDELGAGPDRFLEIESSGASALFLDGWRPTSVFSDGVNEVAGALSSAGTYPGPYGGFAYLAAEPAGSSREDLFNTRSNIILDYKGSDAGAWFFRHYEVPLPTTLWLLGIALFGLAAAKPTSQTRGLPKS